MFTGVGCSWDPSPLTQGQLAWLWLELIHLETASTVALSGSCSELLLWVRFTYEVVTDFSLSLSLSPFCLTSCTHFCTFISFPQGRLEWESDSGRQLTLTDVSVNDLSKVEIQTLQRQSIPKLQAMEIPASHGLLKTGVCVYM